MIETSLKKMLLLCALPVALLCAQEKKAEPKTNPPAQAATAQSIPPGAKEVEPYVFGFTDTQGKKWFYRQTPFGVVRWEDKPAAAPVPAAEPIPIRITDLGDSYQFERQSPFGVQKWVREKSELTEDDKALIDQSRNPQTSARAAKTTEKQ
jgi:hypothetical protein